MSAPRAAAESTLSNGRRARLLMMAYYCQPGRGSEFGTGWNWALESAKDNDTWVISRNGPTADRIKEHLATHGPIPGLNFEFVELPKWQEFLLDLPWIKWFLIRWWHRKALELARRLNEQHHFDLVHHLTCISFREPGELWRLDIPFIWGPIGGADNVPTNFLLESGIPSALNEGLRGLLSQMQLRWSSRVARVARRADRVLFANSPTQKQFESLHGIQGLQLQDTGLRAVKGTPRTPRTDGGPLRVLWSGALEPRKALPLLLKALVELDPNVDVSLRILGEGTMEKRWKRQATRLGLNDRVEWMGWLPYEEAQRQYDWADVFVFTSLRDTGGNVNLEAMANGLPIICLDHQGVHDMVTESCGIKIPVTGPRRVVRDLSDALERVASDVELRASMSAAAIERARDFLWPRTHATIQETYRLALSRSGRDAQPASNTRERCDREHGRISQVEGDSLVAGNHRSNKAYSPA